MGVDLFFVLSGFLITGILLKTKEGTFKSYIGRFYERRARRILPAYVVVLIIAAILQGIWWLRHWYMYIGLMNFIRLLGMPAPADLPLWSLAVEEQFYLLWPIAVYFLSRRHLLWCSCGLIVLATVLRGLCSHMFTDRFAIYMLLPFRMDTLAAGALLALMWPEMRAKVEKSSAYRNILAARYVILGCLAFAILAFMAKHGFNTTDTDRWQSSTFVYACTLAISVSAIVLALLGFGKSMLSSWPMVWLGRLSYSIYLIHLTSFRFIPAKHTLGTVALAALMTLAYSTVMWFLVEQPILTGTLPQFTFWPFRRTERETT